MEHFKSSSWSSTVDIEILLSKMNPPFANVNTILKLDPHTWPIEQEYDLPFSEGLFSARPTPILRVAPLEINRKFLIEDKCVSTM